MAEQFNELFDAWATSYDNAVHGGDVEYREVFNHYETILQKISEAASGMVLEFGVGTGNLTKMLLEKGLEVIGIEPSSNMREIAQLKLPDAKILKGSFLSFPSLNKKVDTIVSSYAFHHLTDREKEQAIKHYTSILKKRGKIIFGDTIFENKKKHEKAILHAKNKGYERLAEDLNTEYYTTIPVLKRILHASGFTTRFERLNSFVWLMEATLHEEGKSLE